MTACVDPNPDRVGKAEQLRVATSAAVTGVPSTQHRSRWIAACGATRRWALRHPHEYALVYGSPVPGYRAPQTTVAPATRVMLQFLSIVSDAVATGAISVPDVSAPLDVRLREQLHAVSADLAPEVPEAVLARTFIAFSQLLGMIGLELYGHFVGSVDPTEPFFEHAVATAADGIGLPHTA